MRNFLNGLFAVALMFSSYLAAASSAPSLSGTVIPSATRIVDRAFNVWTVSDGQVYENGKVTPSSEVILLLCYGGVVFQENIRHDWWVWDSATLVWVASSDPRITSPSGTTVPSATQLIDSARNVWTLSGGQAYEKGELTPSSGVISLLYARGYVYQENIHHDWWVWRTGAWVATPAPTPASASGTTIPSASQIVDGGTDVWTLSGGQAYENHALTPSSEVILVLYYEGSVYQENVHHDWWAWNGQAWASIPSDPRMGQPLAYVASTSPNGTYAVTVIDTGTARVTHTIPIAFQARELAVSPNGKQVYALGSPNNFYSDVAVIDAAQDSVVATVQVAGYPEGIVVSTDGTKYYVLTILYDKATGEYSSILSTVDAATNAIIATLDRPEPETDSGITISPDGKKLYIAGATPCGCVSGEGGAFIDVVSTASNSVLDVVTIPTPLNSTQEDVFNALISPDNTKLYVNYSYDPTYSVYVDEVAVLNPVTYAQTTTLPAMFIAQVFSPNSQYLYGVGMGGVGVINTAANVSTTAVANVPDASQLAITPDGRHLYITDVYDGWVFVADTASYTVSTVLTVGIPGDPSGQNPLGPTGAIAIASAP
jgi:YVTN family beta-propeller protein